MNKLLISFVLTVLTACTSSTKTETSSADSTAIAKADSISTAQRIDSIANTPVEAEEETPNHKGDSPESEDEEAGEDRYPGTKVEWTHTFHGFTPDLKYAAFENSGPDGLDDVGYEMFIVDVAKNSFARSPLRASTYETPEPMRQTIDSQLATFGLPANTGYKVYELGGVAIPIRGVLYSVTLKQTQLPDVPTDWMTDEAGVRGEVLHSGVSIFELILTNTVTKKDYVLQKDKSLPESRGLVKNYSMKYAYVQDNRVAIMIEYRLESERDVESYYSYKTKYLMVTGVIE